MFGKKKDDKTPKKSNDKKPETKKAKPLPSKTRNGELRQKIPKGSDKTVLTNEGSIIMTSRNLDLSDNPVKSTAKPSKPAALKKPAKPSAAKTPLSKSPKTSAPKATKSAAPAVPKKVEPTKKNAHDDYENMVTGDVPLPLGLRAKRKAKKELKRIAKMGGYTAWDGRTGKTFATEKEANDYAAEVSKKTGEKIPVTKTDRQVTHTFLPEEQNKKK